MVDIAYDWSEDVDWGAVKMLATDIHIHPWYTDTRSDEVIEYICQNYAPTPEVAERTGYDIFGLSSIGTSERTSDLTGEEYQGQIYWPWTDPDWRMVRDAEEHPEPVDPEELGTVAFRCREVVGGDVNHFHQIFGDQTGEGSEIPADGWGSSIEEMDKAIEWTIEEQNGRVIEAHPSGEPADYHMWGERNPDRMLGTEIVSAFDEEAQNRDFIGFWDGLNREFASQRGKPVWGFGASDLKQTIQEGDEGMRWETAALVPEGSVNPSEQETSRQAIEEAFVDGRLLAIEREGWDDDTDPVPQVPIITDVDVGDGQITIGADHVDEIEWFDSHGEIIDTGATLSLEREYAPTVRAKLTNQNSPEGETYTQPWLLSNPNTLGDATIGDAQL